MLKILDGSPGFGTPLNQQGIKEFLTTGKLNGYLLSNPLSVCVYCI